MAQSQFKSGGPTRARRRIRKIGMGSGAFVTQKPRKRRRANNRRITKR